MAVAAEQVAQVQPDSGSNIEAQVPSKVLNVDEYVGELLSRIQPAPASELRRKTVAEYVQNVIARAFKPAFEVKAFTYGSVPLKTYLPDGDIDLAIFQSKGPQQLRDSWFNHLASFLQREEYNPAAPYRVKDVHIIHAEVKLVKCLVDNIVVDISFQSLGGLCTVNFLESIDRRIDNHHLFKRSIILVKAWCYYESRLLGAHHGLISTYALETMVLYIFMVYHKTVKTPLEVLHKFLTVFSKFDWNNFCLSLQGPIPVTSFPDPKPQPFPDADGPPLLKEDFIADMRRAYSPPGFSQDGTLSTTPRSFQLKYLNIMDPLLPTNNLGRSVNRSSFARICRALDYGAQRLTAILDMSSSEGVDAAGAFFRNTWNAQRSQVTPKQRSPVTLYPPAKPSVSSEAQRPHSAAHPQSQTLHSVPSSKALHASLFPSVLPNGWQSTQALKITPVLAGTTMPLMLQQQQHLQQVMMQIGQQQMQQNHNMYHGYLHPSLSADSVAAAAATRQRFAKADSLPLTERLSFDLQASRSHVLNAQRPGQQGQSKDTVEVQSLRHLTEQDPPSTSGAGQNGSVQLRQVQSDNPRPQTAQQPGKQLAAASTASLGGTTNGRASAGPQDRASHADERSSNSHGWKEPPMHLPNGMMPQSLWYTSVMQGGQQRMVPVIAPMQAPLGSRVPEYFQVPYPVMPPNGIPGGIRGPVNGFQAGYMPTSHHATSMIPGLASQRHSDPGSAASTLDAMDATLSGDLDRLSQHLQSARAMYDSSPAPSRGSEPYNRYSDNSYKPNYAQGSQRGPTRSSSAGNLNHLRFTSLPNGTRRPAKVDTGSGSSSLPMDTHSQPAVYSSQSNGPRPRVFRSSTQQPHYDHIVQRTSPLESQSIENGAAASSIGSDKAPSRPHSPSKPHGVIVPIAGTPAQAAALSEWPLPSLKGRAPVENWGSGAPSGVIETGRPGWSTASEGRPGWASPVGSTISEQSLASLRGLRANGTSPAPVSPSVRGASLQSLQSGGSYEGHHLPPEAVHENGSPLPPDTGKHWQGEFVLAEEDFPVLPSTISQSQAATPTKAAPKAAGWVPDGKKVPSIT